MAIEKSVVIDKIEVLLMGNIQIRYLTTITEDGAAISQSLSRESVDPDFLDISHLDQKVQDIANVVWTDQVKADWEKHKASSLPTTSEE